MEQLSDFNWFDIAVVSIVLFSTIFAFFKGFLKSLFSLVMWIGSVAVAIILNPDVSAFLSTEIENERAVVTIAFFSVFIISFFVMYLVFGQINHFLRGARGGITDRSLGFAFGLARGIIVVCLLFFSMSRTFSILMPNSVSSPDPVGPDFFVKAKTYNFLDNTTNMLISLLPSEVNSHLIGLITSTTQKISKIDPQMEQDLTSMKDSSVEAYTRVVLTSAHKGTLRKMIKSLSEEDKETLNSQLVGKNGNFSKEDEISMFRKVLSAYMQAKENGKLNSGENIDIEEIKALDFTLNGASDDKEYDKKDETGYKDQNIKQFERLLNSVD